MTDDVFWDAREVLLGAADDITLYGWKSGSAEIEDTDPFGTYPRCVWIALMRSAEAEALDAKEYDVSYDKSEIVWEAEQALIKAAGVETISDVFDINDIQSPEEGKQWAVDLLNRAAELITVPVQSERPKDSVLTEPTESGNTSNAESRVKRFLRKLHLVK